MDLVKNYIAESKYAFEEDKTLSFLHQFLSCIYFLENSSHKLFTFARQILCDRDLQFLWRRVVHFIGRAHNQVLAFSIRSL